MMRYHDIADQVRQLPIEQQLLLLEELTRTLRRALTPKSRPQTPNVPLLRRGMLKTNGPTPTDEELADAYTDYLIEKYR